MKKSIIALSVILSAAASLFAENIETISAKLARHQTTTGNFVQVKTLASNNRNLRSSGDFIFSMDGIAWNTKKPFSSSLAITKTALIQTAPDGKKQVTDTTSNPAFASVSSTIASVFSNDAKKLEENFVAEFKEPESGKWQINLTPKDKTVASVLENMVLAGSATAGEASVDSIIMNEKTGDRITYTFTNQNYPKELTADEKSYFTY